MATTKNGLEELLEMSRKMQERLDLALDRQDIVLGSMQRAASKSSASLSLLDLVAGTSLGHVGRS